MVENVKPDKKIKKEFAKAKVNGKLIKLCMIKLLPPRSAQLISWAIQKLLFLLLTQVTQE